MKDFRVTPIRNGTVIDHIDCGQALKVLRIIGITDSVRSTVSVLLHVPSKKDGWKDVIKVEDRELDTKEVDKISLIAPKATINIIRDFNVAEKFNVKLPDVAKGIVRCGNPNCITNMDEPVETEFIVESKDPIVLRCLYCDRIQEDVADRVV
ncbi:MAG TPA: aspartate carbamoyltransferase regulatory subunit [Methanomassiliicoccaceae archaeon]|jgi:aspartate carbamoyltransferase regulatory subunit|nr:aspartate carbamoyltransferase regulatory subunit [Euryarchaeota archaeon]HOB39311.1 aspartate carbamoyltransferase regulatory subunit [Methanomassiliicoccaceae archaeon]HOK28862.1 aspartate carbamoyltransferase regulatory subunit [Methanomassiliicoccaceae archaeon]HPT73377.1 aspartate carbamoyltransferase regulatory subunit [Methanomassiliicoccaceae archaeon]